MTTDSDVGALWRTALLYGVGTLPATGAVPGTIVVWGTRAHAVLALGDKCQDVIVAAAELGAGRVVSVAHDGLLTRPEQPFQKLYSNIRNWLKKGKDDVVEMNLTAQTTVESLGEPGMSMISWRGGRNLQVSIDTVCEHIISGGSLLHSMCPWGWLQLNPGKTLTDMPLAKVLEICGLAYTDSTSDVPPGGVDVATHFASEKNNTFHNLQYIVRNPDEIFAGDVDIPNLNMNYIPQECIKTDLGAQLKQLVAVYCEGELTNIYHRPAEPVKSTAPRALLDILECTERMKLLHQLLPGVEIFPGAFDHNPEVICQEVAISAERQDIHPTGSYLPPSSTLILNVLTEPLPSGWSARVGCHSDKLYNAKELRRWPKVTEYVKIASKEVEIHSPFGGLVYLESPESPSDIHVCLDGVVEAPLFKSDDPQSLENWRMRREAPGLWADIVGETIIITLPASSVREVDNPLPAIQAWDRVVRAHHDLRGTDPSQTRRQWVVTDEQPSAGYMHSGYPIVTHLDVARPDNNLFLLNEEVLRTKGNWGMYHEIGHNMQRGAWTFQGTGEVTCNIFTLHAMATISGQKVWIHDWLQGNRKRAEKYLNSEAGFSKWQSEPGTALFIYAQVAHVFGWGVYKQVFREYEESMHNWKLNSLQDKIDTWLTKLSRSAGYNLAPLFDFWKFPVSDDAVKDLSDLPSYLPQDEITEACPAAVSRVLDKFPGCVRQLVDSSTCQTMLSH